MQQGLAAKFVELLGMKDTLVKKEICRVLSTLISQNSPLLELYISEMYWQLCIHIEMCNTFEVFGPDNPFKLTADCDRED